MPLVYIFNWINKIWLQIRVDDVNYKIRKYLCYLRYCCGCGGQFNKKDSVVVDMVALVSNTEDRSDIENVSDVKSNIGHCC